MAVDSKEFAKQVIAESNRRGKKLADEVFDADDTITGDDLIPMLQGFMWSEFYLGVLPPVRAMSMLYDGARNLDQTDADVLLGLGDQIRDEVKHSKLFSRRVEELGGDPNLTHYQPTEEDLFLLERTADWDDPLSIITALNCAGEPALAEAFKAIMEKDIVDPRTRDVIHKAKIDEGNHINLGKKILARYAVDDETQARVWEIVDAKFEAAYAFHGKQMDSMSHPDRYEQSPKK
ncbi:MULTISPECIES: ferritin-like domain-containing protein [unclassified Haladaptatus]|uniref:ferritin-like domain-containing protein n=1 Tax=unclassified Haladaptatus TaxID=2622732 RepID=UPI002FCE0F25